MIRGNVSISSSHLISKILASNVHSYIILPLQLKSGSMKLAKLHMNRAVSAIKSSDGSFEDEDQLMLQSVRFAFRVHQVEFYP